MIKEGEFYLQLYATSPAPKRDYHGLTITSKHIILNSWDISHGPHVYPRRRRLSLDNLSLDKAFCAELQFLFGNHVVDYANRVADNDRSLYTLPEKVFRKIIGQLAVGDILRLGQTSKIFFELCNTNVIWKIIFQKKMGRPANKSELALSETMSWRHILNRRTTDKRDTKKIYEEFRKGMANIREQTKKDVEKMRKNASEINVSFEREPPEDLFKTHKIQIKTYKAEAKTDNKRINSSKSLSSELSNMKSSNKFERRIDQDLRTKSASVISNKTDSSKNRLVDKNKKLNKMSKDLQNLKSKSVLL